MSTAGKDKAINAVDRAASRISGYGEFGTVAKGLEAVAWAIVAVAEALDTETKPN